MHEIKDGLCLSFDIFLIRVCTMEDCLLDVKYLTFQNKTEQETIFKLNLWLYGFMLKMVPCIILTSFTSSLIRAMYQGLQSIKTIMKLQSKLFSLQILLLLLLLSVQTELQAAEQNNKLKTSRERRMENSNRRLKLTDRTTKLLIVILILFLIAEFPLVRITSLSSKSNYVFRVSQGCFQQ